MTERATRAISIWRGRAEDDLRRACDAVQVHGGPVDVVITSRLAATEIVAALDRADRAPATRRDLWCAVAFVSALLVLSILFGDVAP